MAFYCVDYPLNNLALFRLEYYCAKEIALMTPENICLNVYIFYYIRSDFLLCFGRALKAYTLTV